MDRTLHVLDCALIRWRPGIGDGTVMGWITVAGYFAAALLAARLAARNDHPAGAAERAFWTFLAVLLVALGVNKQLDLQTFLTAVGRCVAQLDGWYAERRPVQVGFILGLVCATALGVLGLVLALRRTLGRTWLAMLGILALCAFVLARAVGFHRMDHLIGLEFFGWRINWIAELGGIALTSLGALWAMAALRRTRDR